MKLYYDDNLTNKTRQIGSGINKTWFKRKAKKAAVWYFNDRFGVTINVIGLVLMVI